MSKVVEKKPPTTPIIKPHLHAHNTHTHTHTFSLYHPCTRLIIQHNIDIPPPSPPLSSKKKKQRTYKIIKPTKHTKQLQPSGKCDIILSVFFHRQSLRRCHSVPVGGAITQSSQSCRCGARCHPGASFDPAISRLPEQREERKEETNKQKGTMPRLMSVLWQKVEMKLI